MEGYRASFCYQGFPRVQSIACLTVDGLAIDCVSASEALTFVNEVERRDETDPTNARCAFAEGLWFDDQFPDVPFVPVITVGRRRLL